MNEVQIKKLCKDYPSFSLSEVSFNLHSGRITGFIGRNGAGKTTTIKSMLNLVHTDSGEILYFGKSLSDNENDIKKRIGYNNSDIQNKSIKRVLSEKGKTVYATELLSGGIIVDNGNVKMLGKVTQFIG